MKIVVSFALGLGMLLSATGCGQKGALMLPAQPAPGTATPQPSGNAASTPR